MAGMTDKQWADVVAFPETLSDSAALVPAQRPEDLNAGDRVAEIYASTRGTVKAIIGTQVRVIWDDPQPEDDMLPLPEFHELVRLG